MIKLKKYHLQGTKLIKEININNELIIRKSDAIVKSRYKLNPLALKFVTCLIAGLKRSDDINQIYIFKIKDFKELTGLKRKDLYAAVEIALDELLKKPLHIPTENGFIKANWVADAEYIENQGLVEFTISRKLRPFLLEAKEKFLKYKLENILPLRSSYSIRMYELLKDWFETFNRYGKNTEKIVKLDELREILEIPIKYRFSDIKRQILNKALEDLKKYTDIIFSYEEIKTGRKVTHLKFKIQLNPKKIRNLEDLDYIDKYFKNIKSFILFLRKQYSGNRKFFACGTSPDKNGTFWYGLDEKGYLYASYNGNIVDFDFIESEEKYRKFYKLAKNSEMYRELLKSGVNLFDLKKENEILFNELMKEFNEILKK
jgi:plasmid replication initiation protein